MASLAFPKPRPAKLERADRTRARAREDEAENKKVRARSGGRCEVEIIRELRPYAVIAIPCHRRAAHIHHKIGGWGKRARGVSILAENKLHVCPQCHADIHGHVLVPDGKFFRRVK